MKEMRSIDVSLFALSSLNNDRIDIGAFCTFNIPLSQKAQIGQADESARRDQSDLIVNQLPATMQIISKLKSMGFACYAQTNDTRKSCECTIGN
jgi:hypothetical protein